MSKSLCTPKNLQATGRCRRDFNCKVVPAHVLAPLADAILVLQRGKFEILEESSAVAGDDPKNFGIAVEWISSERIDICWLTLA